MKTTARYALPYPDSTDHIRDLPNIIQQQAQGIDDALARFDYGGGDQNGLTARVASLETLLADIQNNMVVLFDNDNNVFAGAITLLETAANFERFTIMGKTNDGVYVSMDVVNPDGKKIILSTAFNVYGQNSIWVKTRAYLIDGTTINTSTSGHAYSRGETDANSTNQFKGDDVITITQVIGYRKMNLA